MTESFRLVSNMRKSILEAKFDEFMEFTIIFTIDTRSEDDQCCGISTGPRRTRMRGSRDFQSLYD